MLRKLLIVGVCAGSSASVPILYQANPETFHRLVARVAGQAAEPPGPAAAAPEPAAQRQPVENQLGRKVQLAANARGHFVSDFRINGRSISAIVDTGATLVALNVSTARRAGIVIAPSDFRYTVETANGKVPAAPAKIASLQIGRIVVENVDAVVLADKALGETLIGVSFLKRLGRYQVEGDTLYMTQ